MKPSEREDLLYKRGKVIRIDRQERILFNFIDKYVPLSASVADIGCGTGEICALLMQKGYNVVGFDFSPIAIKNATEKGISAQVVDFDESGIPLPTAAIDCVYAGDIVEHVFDPLFLFQEFHRILKPGGVILASVPHDSNLSSIKYALLARSYQEALYEKLGACKHHSFISVDMMRLFSQRANLSVINIVLIGYPNFINRHKSIERYYLHWNIPIWVKYLTYQLCLVLKKTDHTEKES